MTNVTFASFPGYIAVSGTTATREVRLYGRMTPRTGSEQVARVDSGTPSESTRNRPGKPAVGAWVLCVSVFILFIGLGQNPVTAGSAPGPDQQSVSARRPPDAGAAILFDEDLRSPDLVIDNVSVSELKDVVSFTLTYRSGYKRNLIVFDPPDKEVIDIFRAGAIQAGRAKVSIEVEKDKLTKVESLTVMFGGQGENCIFISWPPQRLPEGFDLQAATQWGMDPGLGVRSLHERGITGRGVHVAVIDFPLLENHVEYKDQLVQYRKINCQDAEAHMHGSGMASLFVGKQCGVAPGALLHFWAVPDSDDSYRSYITALEEVIAYNQEKTLEDQIRVVSISKGLDTDWPDLDRWKEVLQQAETHGIYVIHSGDLQGVGCPMHLDKNDPASYQLCHFAVARGTREIDPETVCAPVDHRTTAHPKGPNAYRFVYSGGLSEGAPYLAGVAALGLQVNPQLTPRQIRDFMRTSGMPFSNGAIVNPAGFIEAAVPRRPAG